MFIWAVVLKSKHFKVGQPTYTYGGRISGIPAGQTRNKSFTLKAVKPVAEGRVGSTPTHRTYAGLVKRSRRVA